MRHVLFMCRRNAGRSQMSQALFERATDLRATAQLSRPQPAERVEVPDLHENERADGQRQGFRDGRPAAVWGCSLSVLVSQGEAGAPGRSRFRMRSIRVAARRWPTSSGRVVCGRSR